MSIKSSAAKGAGRDRQLAKRVWAKTKQMSHKRHRPKQELAISATVEEVRGVTTFGTHVSTHVCVISVAGAPARVAASFDLDDYPADQHETGIKILIGSLAAEGAVDMYFSQEAEPSLQAALSAAFDGPLCPVDA